jgi:hypothetical protein
VRKVLAVTAITAVGMALISCSEPPTAYAPTTSRMVYEPPAQIERAPLPPPLGYASTTSKTPAPLALSAKPPDDDGSEPKATTAGEWRSSPRWAAVKGQDCIVIEQDAQAKFAAADTAKVKIQNCSKEDLRAGQEVSASQSTAQEPGSSPRSPESKLPSGSDEPSPSNPPTLPPSENPSDGAIEPWTGAI